MKLLAQQVEAIAAQLFETLEAQPQPADLRRHLSFPLPDVVISALMGECASTLSEAERGTTTGIPGGP
ncbi:hypothetical protein MesoLj131a_61540 [Mesorhizobium sp. 131-2-1]|nr:hypothetical protein MesoLj131a_61540 [Mesorhizobium sp. 131-2-1]BCH04361.1 hypothetical protein MesoLj131b_63600 [Mesorhizobium sp. 131-2-5]